MPDGGTRDFASIAEARRQTGISAGCISEACNGNYAQVCGSVWSFIEPAIKDPEMDALIDELCNSVMDATLQDEKEMDEFIDSFLE